MAQLPYWILLDSQPVGVLLFALPRLSVKTAKFGYRSPMCLIELARLWIHPSVQNSHIVDSVGRHHSLPVASAAIGQALRRVQRDWRSKYPGLPHLEACVTWADQTRHEGTIYRAANFKYVGTSGERRRRATGNPGTRTRIQHPDYAHPKSAFLFEFPCRSGPPE